MSSSALSRELSPAGRRVLLLAATVQLSLATFAWTDLAHRPAELVRGPKPVWAAIIAINFFGPIAYLAVGRLAAAAPSGAPAPD